MGTIIGIFGDHFNRKDAVSSDYVDREFTITVYRVNTFGRLGHLFTVFEKVSVAMVDRSRGLIQSQGLLREHPPVLAGFHWISLNFTDFQWIRWPTTRGTSGATLWLLLAALTRMALFPRSN